MKTRESSGDMVVVHALDPEDAPAIAGIRTATRPQKGAPWRIEARKFYDALLEGVSPRDDVTFESAVVGGVPGVWVRPASSRSDEAILHVHGGWFVSGSATAYRHLVGHIAARANASAFVPAYRLAPQQGRRFRIVELEGFFVEFRGEATIIDEVIFHQPNGTFVAKRVDV